jgi:hypothetical protein
LLSYASDDAGTCGGSAMKRAKLAADTTSLLGTWLYGTAAIAAIHLATIATTAATPLWRYYLILLL